MERSRRWRSGDVSSGPISAITLHCDLGQVSISVWASVFPSVKWRNEPDDLREHLEPYTLSVGDLCIGFHFGCRQGTGVHQALTALRACAAPFCCSPHSDPFREVCYSHSKARDAQALGGQVARGLVTLLIRSRAGTPVWECPSPHTYFPLGWRSPQQVLSKGVVKEWVSEWQKHPCSVTFREISPPPPGNYTSCLGHLQAM